mmetsp:Transcript_30215/g.87808  ORF Transcript_30215/g.87808 Transcript_30215/m.87808 type:complete len:176 (-) Transcript_30215:182-709(-)
MYRRDLCVCVWATPCARQTHSVTPTPPHTHGRQAGRQAQKSTNQPHASFVDARCQCIGTCGPIKRATTAAPTLAATTAAHTYREEALLVVGERHLSIGQTRLATDSQPASDPRLEKIPEDSTRQRPVDRGSGSRDGIAIRSSAHKTATTTTTTTQHNTSKRKATKCSRYEQGADR